MYEGVKYGFAQGGMRKKVMEAEVGERAEEQAVQWLGDVLVRRARVRRRVRVCRHADCGGGRWW